MNSKLDQLIGSGYGITRYGNQYVISGDLGLLMAHIRQAVAEEILGLKPNNPYKTTDGQVPESFEAPAYAYDVANGDWEQKIKEWSQS